MDGNKMTSNSYDLFDFEMTDDRRRTKEINGKTYVYQASDPYGFWSVFRVEGTREIPINGLFTSMNEAEKAAAVDSNKNEVPKKVKKEKE